MEDPMDKKTILDFLETQKKGAIFAEKENGKFKLWATYRDFGNRHITFAALEREFLDISTEAENTMILLGTYNSLNSVDQAIASAKTSTESSVVKKLHRVTM